MGKQRWSRPLFVAAVAAAMLTTGALSAAADNGPRVYNGYNASVANHPWMAFVMIDKGHGTFGLCGGSLVRSDKVVTAAHCVVSGEGKETAAAGSIHLVFGRDNVSDMDESTQVSVKEVWAHPAYTSKPTSNDIAVLTLAQPVPVEPIKLAEPTDTQLYAPGTAATLLGWGRTDDSNLGSTSMSQLRGAALTVAPFEECRRPFGLSDASAQQMVCAGGPRDGQDACRGDSGGPLFVGDKLIGVVSFGAQCQELRVPGVYAKVAYFRDTLESVL